MTEDDRPQLWQALLKARAAIARIPKSATNPHFRSAYTPLEDMLAAVLPALRDNGLVLVAMGSGEPSYLDVAIVHAGTGQAVHSLVPIVGASDMQKLGGAYTYATRYGLANLLGLELEGTDDDGNTASAPAPARRATAPKASASAPPSAPPANGRTAGQGRPSEAPARSVAQGKVPVGKWSCPTCGGQSVFSNKESGKMYCWIQAGGCGAEWKTREAWDAAHPPVPPPSVRPDAESYVKQPHPDDDDPGFLSDL